MFRFNIKKISILIAVIALLIFLHFTKITAAAESFIGNVLSPLFKNVYSFSSYLRSGYNLKTDRRDLAKSIKILKEEVAGLTVENARLKAAENENKILREYLNFSVKNNSSLVLANIISRSGLNLLKLDQPVIIDKGARDGLEEGMAVLDSQGVVVGKVTSVKDGFSEICLINSETCKFAAAVSGGNKTSGVAGGELGLTVKMNFIPQTENIKEGDIIVTSGLEEGVPASLVIGKVSRISKESNELWQNATLESLADVENLTIVSILLPNKPDVLGNK